MSKAQPHPVSSVPNLSGASQFIYDEAGQLVKEIADSPFYKYAYDSKGNILTAKEYAVSVNDNGEKVYTLRSDGNNTFVYGNTWQDMLTSFNGESITYDAIGNPLSYKGNTLTWTMGRQLAAYGTNTYTYNEDGIRTSKTVNGVTTKYYLNGTDIIEQTDGTNTLHFYYDNTGEIIGFTYNDNEYFYIKNAQDDIVAIADDLGNVISEYAYDPWGSVVSVTGSNIEIANLNPFRYRSYYYDFEINMYYLQSRYYDPEICRFINCDDVNYIGLTESEISYNPFTYCENNPVNNTDFSGHKSISELLKHFRQALDAFEAILKYIKNTFKKDLKKIRDTVKLLSKKTIKKKKALEESIEQINKINKRLGKIGKIVTIVAFIIACGESRMSGKSYIYILTELIVEGFITAVEKSLSFFCKQISKLVPSVGFILGIFSSFVVTTLFSLYFTESKISSLATKLKNQLSKYQTINTNILFNRLLKIAFS